MIQVVKGKNEKRERRKKKEKGRKKESEKREELPMTLRGHALYTGGTARLFRGAPSFAIAEREPLPTTVASASPVCYNLFCEEGTFTITVLSFDAVFGLAAVLNQRRISGLGAAAGVW